MRYFFLIVLFLFVEGYAEEEKNDISENELAHGFGDDIEWVKWSDAKERAKTLKKPIFLLIHKSWCGACQALKTTFRSSAERDEFVQLSKEFVMVNTEDDEEPDDERYSPDGQYIPRIFFLDVDGAPYEDISNKAAYPRNSHYFPRLPNLIKAMKKAIKAFASPKSGGSDQTSKDDDSTEKQELETNEETDQHTECPHAAKARAMKKEQEETKKKENTDKVRSDERETDMKSDSKEKEEDTKEKEEESDERENDEKKRKTEL